MSDKFFEALNRTTNIMKGSKESKESSNAYYDLLDVIPNPKFVKVNKNDRTKLSKYAESIYDIMRNSGNNAMDATAPIIFSKYSEGEVTGEFLQQHLMYMNKLKFGPMQTMYKIYETIVLPVQKMNIVASKEGVSESLMHLNNAICPIGDYVYNMTYHSAMCTISSFLDYSKTDQKDVTIEEVTETVESIAGDLAEVIEYANSLKEMGKNASGNELLSEDYYKWLLGLQTSLLELLNFMFERMSIWTREEQVISCEFLNMLKDMFSSLLKFMNTFK